MDGGSLGGPHFDDASLMKLLMRKLAFNAQGQIVGLQADVIGDVGAYSIYTPGQQA